ncbi:MAG: hypothetical protein HZB50_18260 [Chloroflexi bacterium]|nr:hypothetical protein [Chloroflexota bacterium]
MKKHLLLYLKAFIYLSLFVGIGMNIVPPILTGFILGYSWHEIISEIIRSASWIWSASIAGGILFSLTAVTYHIMRVHSLPTHDSENILSTLQTRSIRLPMGHEAAFKACISSLMIVNAKILEQENLLRIKAQTPFGWKSIEEVEFVIARITDSETYVRFTSRPKLKTGLIDFGESIEVVEKIYWYLEEKSNK